MENGTQNNNNSSTLMNKFFELIEAQKLFNLPPEKLDIIIHLIFSSCYFGTKEWFETIYLHVLQ